MGPVDSATAAEISRRVLSIDDHWGASLLAVSGLQHEVARQIVNITGKGMRETLKEVL